MSNPLVSEEDTSESNTEDASLKSSIISQEESPEQDDQIQNEMVKSKMPLAASVMLTKLPPDSTKVVAKLEKTSQIKIAIRCQPIGSTPALSPNVFKISYDQPFATLIKFITRRLKKKIKNESIYCYIKNSFSPSPDEIIGSLFEHFSTNDELVVSYCTVVAFG